MSHPSYQIDLHSHSFFSADGVSHPDRMIEAARKKGLQGFAITDHNTCEAVDYFLSHGLMRPDGLPVNDFLIIPGVEVSTAEGHLLCIGAKLENAQALEGQPATIVCDVIHKAGAIAIPPHPYDVFRAGIRRPILDHIPIDAIEVFNAANTMRQFNRKAYEYALTRGLPMISASDSHHEMALGTAYTIFEIPTLSVAEVLKAIREGRTQLQQSYLRPKDKLRKTWNNWMRATTKKKRGKQIQASRDSISRVDE